MAKRIAINGFGRIGRLTLRNLLQKENVEIVAVNDLTDNATLAHLFKHDSTHGTFAGTVASDDQHIYINGKSIHAYAERDPSKLPWGDLGIDVVLECTGFFRKKEQAELHLHAGAKKVIISAPAKSEDIPTIVLGVNEDTLTGQETIISNASCTTNCLAPTIKLIEENWGLEQGSMTTIHAYTADQRLQDAPHSDLRRARAAAINIIPTTTGAATAVAKVLPGSKGKLMAMAVRVPTITGSLTDLSMVLKQEVTAEAVNAVFKQAAEQQLKGILQYSEAPLVSTDIVGNPYSCIFDSQLTKADGKFLKIVGWYDNEAGYAARLADLALF